LAAPRLNVIYFTAKHIRPDHHHMVVEAQPGLARPVAGARVTQRSAGRRSVKPEFAFHYNRGLSLERSGKYEQAVEAYGEAIRSQPFDVDALVHLGLILRELGRDEEANRVFLAALDVKRQATLPPVRRPGDLPFDVSS
jgi:Flp pilus assembly protein TadD